MAENPGTSSETITETVQTSTPPPQQEGRSLTIKLRKRKTEKKVEWSSDTVDNEHLGRRSSKCCCIYEKPRQFGESSSESEGDDDDEGCGSAHCILGHGRRAPGPGQRGGGGTTVPPNTGGSHTH
ncbi:E3 ubiquitin-protein ligase PPP1R11 [Sebastes fasciatus]|uniref:E3 ubiquitin-protein ligase PPP1R11 n=1 Tax=Sebastes fasciatus TaxID=394691 RepID=UPI003D9F5E5D